MVCHETGHLALPSQLVSVDSHFNIFSQLNGTMVAVQYSHTGSMFMAALQRVKVIICFLMYLWTLINLIQKTF